MIRLKCNCKDNQGVDLVLRGRSFECLTPIPEDDFMIAPLDVEAVGPETAVTVGKMEYLTHAKVFMDLKGGVGINCPNPGVSGTMTVEVYADGQKIFNNPLVFSGQTMTVPRTGLKTLWQTIQANTRLDVQVTSMSNPGAYPAYRGLRVVFLPQAIEIP